MTSAAREAEEGEVGEIWVRGPSKAIGYWQKPALSSEIFEARLPCDTNGASGWLRTGDMGFLHDGELYVCGRYKDMLIVRGLNYYPQDIEALVEEDDRIRKGSVAAFAREQDGGERLVVVAELRDARRVPDPHDLNRRLLAGLGVTAANIVFIEPRTIPKTSSGKIARHAVQERWLDGWLDGVTLSKAEPEPFAQRLAGMGCSATQTDDLLRVQLPEGESPQLLWRAAAEAGEQIRHLRPQRSTLEEIFLTAVEQA
jgi:acyl-CoA synthetase (AMP-forming)/AMP-acid ligase II